MAANQSSSSISTAGLESIIERLRYQTNRSSTQKVYYQVWKSFNQFFIRLDVKPKKWEDRLVLYVGHLVDQQRKSTTIKSYISAIRYVLRQDGVELDRNSTLLTSLTKACQLKNDTVKTHLPIQIKLVQLLVKSLEKYYQNNPQPYLTKLYRALFLTAYYGLFRIGELASSEHCVKVKDVHVGMNKQKMLFILHSSKTHGKHNKPQIIKINGSPGPYCMAASITINGSVLSRP